jgi:hypothetical protein
MILFTLMLKINNDFKKLIFCFLRKDPKKKCYNCGRVCVWDKRLCDYITYPLLDNSLWVNECRFCLNINQITSAYS